MQHNAMETEASEVKCFLELWPEWKLTPTWIIGIPSADRRMFEHHKGNHRISREFSFLNVGYLPIWSPTYLLKHLRFFLLLSCLLSSPSFFLPVGLIVSLSVCLFVCFLLAFSSSLSLSFLHKFLPSLFQSCLPPFVPSFIFFLISLLFILYPEHKDNLVASKVVESWPYGRLELTQVPKKNTIWNQ